MIKIDGSEIYNDGVWVISKGWNLDTGLDGKWIIWHKRHVYNKVEHDEEHVCLIDSFRCGNCYAPVPEKVKITWKLIKDA